MKLHKTAMVSASAIAMAAFAAPAAAQSAEDWAKMEARMNAMEQRLGTQEQELESANARAAAAEQRAAAAEQKVAAAPAAAPINVEWKGAPKISNDKGFSFKPRGRILYDVANIDLPSTFPDTGLTTELRRARLGVEGTVPGGFGYKFEADFAGNKVELTDVFLDYTKGGLIVTAGQHNNFQSLEELSSSNDTSFMERAAFTDAFNFERKVGLSAQYTQGDLSVQGGVFTDNLTSSDLPSSNELNLDGRIVYAPKMADTQLHLGASIHHTDYGSTTGANRFRQRPFLHGTSRRPLDTGSITANSMLSYGLEAAAINGPLHGAVEAHWLKANAAGSSNDPSFFGGYAEVGYFLTDNSRGYKGGMFKGPKVKNGFDHGGMGAVQVALRYDYLDLVDAGIVGGTQNGYQLAINWWPVEYVRMALNYGHMEYDNALSTLGAGNTEYSADVVGARFQVAF